MGQFMTTMWGLSTGPRPMGIALLVLSQIFQINQKILLFFDSVIKAHFIYVRWCIRSLKMAICSI